MSRFTGPQRRGAGRLERTRRTAHAIRRQVDAAERNQAETTDPEQDCE